MPKLSESGVQLVNELSARHGVSQDGVMHMLSAVANGNGSMAQFNHPDFGGSGQWMQGGMTMVSDLFNHQLKSRVNNLCADISGALANHQTQPWAASFQSQSQSGGGHGQQQATGGSGGGNTLFVPDPSVQWWPKELGNPSATGSQNNMKYAYFADRQRLAVTTGGPAWVYDTLEHRIGGFSQQQGGGSSITLSSQFGTVNLSSLPLVMRDGQAVAPAQPATMQPATTPNQPAEAPTPASSTPVPPAANPVESPTAAMQTSQAGSVSSDVIAPADADQIFATLERLGSLKEKGIVTEQEFNDKKRELLARL